LAKTSSNGGSRGNKPKPENRPMPIGNEYAQPIEQPVKKSSHRERRQQLAQQQGQFIVNTTLPPENSLTITLFLK